jgi:16S rRNA (guanine527-N7)-methyltransferase
MELPSIAEALQPLLSAPLFPPQLEAISIYLNILLRWNARINLTSVRQPEQILTRHFGESLFTAQHLFPAAAEAPENAARLIDIGSGAGFPGLPIKIACPGLRVTLIESSQKKTTFLREVVRALALSDVEVFCGRAEAYTGDLADVVTLRAVERFEKVMPVSAQLAATGSRLALLIGQSQLGQARETSFDWGDPLPIPLSENRVLLVGVKQAKKSNANKDEHES